MTKQIKMTKQQIDDGDYEVIMQEIDAAAEAAPCTITLEIEISTDEEEEKVDG